MSIGKVQGISNMKFCKFLLKKKFLILALVVLIALLFSMLRISENCMFICNKNALTNTMKYDFSKADALLRKFADETVPSCSCAVMKDGEIVNRSMGAKPKRAILAML